MAEPLTKKVVGLHTAQNRYDVPEGALVQAMNVIIKRDGIIQPRWSSSILTNDTRYSSGGAKVDYWHRISPYRDSLYFAGYEYNSTQKYYIAASQGDFTNVAPVVLDTGVIPPDGISAYLAASTDGKPFFDVEFLEAGRNLYYTTFYGLRRFDDTVSGTSRPAGNYPCAVSCFPRPTQLSAGTLVRTTNVTTVTWPHAHGFVTGLVVHITASSDASFPVGGPYTITSVPSTTTFTYANAAADANSTANVTMGVAQFVGSNGFITTNEQTAYRACLVEYDANGTMFQGEMSPRVEIINASPYVGAGANKNVQGAVVFPSGSVLARKTKIQVYRSAESTAAPGDDLRKVYERYLTDAERANGYAWFTDITNDTVRSGESAYTNESQEGIQGNNLPPPAAKTVALWKDRIVACNTAGRAKVELSLLSTDSASGGLANADLFTIIESPTSSSYLAQTTAVTSGTGFLLSTSGTGSILQECKQTVMALCDAINWGFGASTVAPLATWRAGFLSSGNNAPGQFFIERVLPDFNEPDSTTAQARIIGSSGTASGRSAFAPQPAGFASTSGSATRAANVTTVTVSATAQFVVGEYVTVYTSLSDFYAGTPAAIAGTNVAGKILTAGGGTITIDNTGTNGSVSVGSGVAITQGPIFNPDRATNRICVSKVRMFEAFPAFSYYPVGTDANVIEKAARAGDSLMLFTSEGLFRARENGSEVLIDVVDPTAIIWARDTVVRYKDNVLAWFVGGVGVCDENSVKYVSNPIADKLTNTTALFALYAYPRSRRAFATVNPEEELYDLRISWGVGSVSGTAPMYSERQLVYNLSNNTWTEDDVPTVHMCVYQGRRYYITYTNGETTTPLRTQRQGAWYGGDFIAPTVSFAMASGGIAGTNPWTFVIPTGSVSGGTPVAGDIYQGTSGALYRLDSVATGGGNYTMVISGLFGTADLEGEATLSSLVRPTTSTIEWAPITLVEENKLKLFQEVEILFGSAEVFETNVSFYTELITTQETVDAGDFAGQYSSLTIQQYQYRPANLRLAVPQQHRRAQQLSVILSIPTFGLWNVQGLAVKAEVLDTRVRR